MSARRWVFLGLAALALGWAPGTAAESVAPGDPVVLVHGWHGAGADDSLVGSSLATWGRWLAADGLDVRWASAVAVDPAHSMDDSAEALARHVAAAAADHPGRPVRIVAHSYGGLVARAFLETGRYERLRAAGTRVSELITLGAPMGGIDVWLPLLFVLGDPFNEPSVWELTPAAMAAFNKTHAQPAGTRYVVVAGDARRQVPLLWLLPASDGAVTVSSAHALDGSGRDLSELRTDNVHSTTSYTRLFGWRSLLDDHNTFRLALGALGFAAVRQADKQTPVWGAGGGERFAGLAHTPVATADLGPGEDRTLQLGPARALGYLVALDPGLRVGGSGPDAEAADQAGPATDAAPLLGRSALVLPAGPRIGTLHVQNTGLARARMAWMGLVAPPDRAVGIAAHVDGDRVIVTGTGPADFRASRVAVLGRDGPRPVEQPSRPSGRALGTLRHYGPGDLLYIQVTGTLDGRAVQVETTLQVPAGAAATD